MEKFIFPGKIMKCKECGQENGLFVEINSKEESFMFGFFCHHSGISVRRHKIDRRAAVHLLEKEKQEAEYNLQNIQGFRREAILKFLSDANRALFFLRGIKYPKAA